MRYDFLLDTYRTERLKTLSVWSQVPDDRMAFRPEPRARTPHEQMVHQCVSEDTWMRTMLGIVVSLPPLPPMEHRLGFLEHYAAASSERLALLQEKPDAWFEEETTFFDVRRTRAWVMTRRLTHSAHHRGQLTTYLRLRGRPSIPRTGPRPIPAVSFNTRRRLSIDTSRSTHCSKPKAAAARTRRCRVPAIVLRRNGRRG